MSSLSAALSLAQRGLPVFRLKRGTKDVFIDSDWARGGAKLEPHDIYDQFGHGHYNVGVLASRFLILDVDKKHGKDGFAELARIEAANEPLPDTFRQATPSDGQHIIFDAGGEKFGQRDLAPGINVRATNGYIVGAGSEFEGKPYTVLNDAPIAPLPAWLRQLVQDAPTKDLNAGKVQGELDTPAALASAAAYVRDIAAVVSEGSRDNTAFRIAAGIYDYGVSYDVCRGLLEQWNAEKCSPPLEEADLNRIANSALVNRQKAIGADNPLDGFEAFEGFGDAEDDYFDDNLFCWRDTKEETDAIPPMQWVARNLLARGNVTLLGAPGSSGKSAYTLQLATAIALGRGDLIDLEIVERTNVLIINNEDSRDVMRQRLGAVFEHHGLPRSDAHGKIFLWSGLNKKFRMTQKTGRGSAVDAGKLVAKLIRAVKRENIGVVVFDPLASLHNSAESDNSEMQQVMDAFTSFAGANDVAVMLAHHTIKPPSASSESYAGNVNSIRGASAIKDACRVALTGYRMSEKDGETYNIPANIRHRYVRFDDAKANHNEMAAEPKWFCMESVKVGTESIVALRLAPEVIANRQAVGDGLVKQLAGYCGTHGALSVSAVVALFAADEFYKDMTSTKLKKLLLSRFKKTGVEIVGDMVLEFKPNGAEGGTFTVRKCDG